MVQRSHKVGRAAKEKRRRKAVIVPYKGKQIIRTVPPTKEKKVFVTQELVKDPKTGKAKYVDVVKVKDQPRKSDGNVLYIPKVAPEKERRYLRAVKPQFEKIEKRYQDPSKWGTLEAYQKKRLLSIAKENYDLPDKLVKYMSKDDVIRFIKKRYKKGLSLDVERFMPREVKLQKVEPIRPGRITYRPSTDPTDPFGGKLQYEDVVKKTQTIGKGKAQKKVQIPEIVTIEATGAGYDPKSLYANMNAEIDAYIQKEKAKGRGVKSHMYYDVKGMQKFGEYRPMKADLYQQFKQGTAPKQRILAEIVTHIDLPYEDRIKLHTLNEKQVGKLYKKLYKHSTKKREEGQEEMKYEEPFRFPEFKFQPNAPHYSSAPVLIDVVGEPHVASKKNIPKAMNIYEQYDKRAQVPEIHQLILKLEADRAAKKKKK